MYSWMRLACTSNIAAGSTSTAATRFTILAEPLLVGALDCPEPVAETRRRCANFSTALNCSRSVLQPGPMRCIEQICQTRIRRQQPSPLRDAVGLVAEFLRPQLIEVGHQARLDQFGVQLRHAVHRMAADDRQMRHADLGFVTFLDDRYALQAFGIVAPDSDPRRPESAD